MILLLVSYTISLLVTFLVSSCLCLIYNNIRLYGYTASSSSRLLSFQLALRNRKKDKRSACRARLEATLRKKEYPSVCHVLLEDRPPISHESLSVTFALLVAISPRMA